MTAEPAKRRRPNPQPHRSGEPLDSAAERQLLGDLYLVLQHGGGLRELTEWEQGFIKRLSKTKGHLTQKQKITIWELWCDICLESAD